MKNKEFKFGSIYLVANIINKAIAFITVPIFTRMLTTGEYGIVSTYTSYVAILQYFMGLSSEYTIRNAFIDHENDIPQYMASIFSLSCICSAIVTFLVVALNFFVNVASTWICLLCLFQSFMTFIVNAISYKLMMEKKHMQRAFIIAGPNIVSVVFGIILVLMISSEKEMGRIYGYVISYAIFGLSGLYIVFKQKNVKFSSKYWQYIISITPPLVIHGLSMTALSQLDRIMITSMNSSSETGIYSIVYSLSMVSSAVTQAIQGIWTPWFTEKYKNGNYEEIDNRASSYLMLVAILTIFIMLVAPEVLKIMTPNEYWSGIKIIPPLVVSSYFMYMYYYYVGLELHEKKTKIISNTTLIAMLFNTVTNYIFIPKYGALAAAYTTLLSYILLFVLHCHNVRKINNNIFKLTKFLYPSSMIIITSFAFYAVMDIFWIRWLAAIVVVSFAGIKIVKKSQEF